MKNHYQVHAEQCGMTKGKAISIAGCVGHKLAYPIVSPETLESNYPAGYVLTEEDSIDCSSLGIDYAVIE